MPSRRGGPFSAEPLNVLSRLRTGTLTTYVLGRLYTAPMYRRAYVPCRLCAEVLMHRAAYVLSLSEERAEP